MRSSVGFRLQMRPVPDKPKKMFQLKKIYPAMITVLSTVPLVASAAGLDDLLNRVKGTITGVVIPFLFVVATLIFIYAIIQFITKSGDEAEQKKARGLILWSVIGLAAIISLWALVGFLTQYVGTAPIPTTIQ